MMGREVVVVGIGIELRDPWQAKGVASFDRLCLRTRLIGDRVRFWGFALR